MNSDLDSSLNLYQAFKEYKWYNSYNVPIEIQCGVSRLEVPLDLKISSDDMPQDIYMNAQIICNQIPLHECPISTRFGDLDTSKNMISWDAILTFPVKFRDLSQDALLVLTAWSGDGTVVGGTSLRFFDDNGCLKRGKQKLVFYFNKVGDSNVNRFQNTTPGESYDLYAPWDYSFQMEKHLETFQRNALQSNTDPSSIIKKRTEWLDRLTLQRIKGALSLSNELRDPSSVTIVNNDTFWGQSPEEIDLNHICFLVVELPNYQYPILHEEKHYPSVMVHTPLLHADDIAVGCVTREDNGNLEFTLVGRQFNPQSLCVVADWDLEQENLAEKQYRSLAHDKIRGAADPKIKPNLQEKEKLDRLIQMAADTLSENDKDLLYKFRYALTDNKRALVKLLLSINWNVPSEISELPTLLGLWKEKSPIELSDALKLLGREEAFQNPTVRMYAVDTLHTANDDELLTYLLQLVQALRYEPDNGKYLIIHFSHVSVFSSVLI